MRADHSKFVSMYIRMIQTEKSVFKEEDCRNKNICVSLAWKAKLNYYKDLGLKDINNNYSKIFIFWQNKVSRKPFFRLIIGVNQNWGKSC